MSQHRDPDIGSASLAAAIYDDQALCTELLATIAAPVPLQILKSRISGAGAGLFTSEEIGEGEDVFHSQPLINCVDKGKHKLVCDYCYGFKESRITTSGRFSTTVDERQLNLMTCGGCKLCHYCSKQCQRKAWKSYHKYECALLGPFVTSFPSARSLLRLVSMQTNGLLSHRQWMWLNELKAHSTEHLLSNAQILVEVSRMTKVQTGTELIMPQIIDLYCRVLTNSICNDSAEGDQLGTSLDIVTSLINHSCDPNVFVFFEGKSLRVRSLRKLEAGEEITLHYAEDDTDVLIRRPVLKTRYFFQCSCSICERQIQTYEAKFPGKTGQLEQCQRRLNELAEGTNNTSEMEKVDIKLQEIMEQTFPAEEWPEDFDPLPLVRLHFGKILWHQNRIADALKQIFRGGLRRGRHTGPSWIHNLFDLVQAIAKIIAMLEHNPDLRKDFVYRQHEFPNRDQLWDIMYGYLYVLVRSTAKIYGPEIGYTKAVRAWYEDCMEQAPYEPGTCAFNKRYKKAQAILLTWAGVDEKAGITLAQEIKA